MTTKREKKIKKVWAVILGMPIKTHKDGLTALCYCLYEMTWAGYSQQPIQKRINRLNKIAKECLEPTSIGGEE